MKKYVIAAVLVVFLPLGAAADCKDREPLPRPGPMERHPSSTASRTP